MISRKVRRCLPSPLFSFFKPLRIKVNCIQGTTSTATKSDAPSTTLMPNGNHFTKSFMMPFIVSNKGKKVMEMANVALKIDEKNSLAE